MFDHLRCDWPLPDASVQGDIFHVTGLAGKLDQYLITSGGRLLHQEYTMEEVPETQRPKYGTPEWDSPLGRLLGSVRRNDLGWSDIKYHGELYFQANGRGLDDQWLYYVAKFQRGQLQTIRRVTAKAKAIVEIEAPAPVETPSSARTQPDDVTPLP